MEEQEKDLNYLFNEVPLYSKEKFNILYQKDDNYYINKKELERFSNFISTDNRKIITNCIWCNRNFSFDYRRAIYISNFSGYFSERRKLLLVCGEGAECSLDLSNDYEGTKEPYKKEDLYTANYYITFCITCNNEPSHCYYMSILARVENGIITVIKIRTISNNVICKRI